VDTRGKIGIVVERSGGEGWKLIIDEGRKRGRGERRKKTKRQREIRRLRKE
jgi:hypothetical protein